MLICRIDLSGKLSIYHANFEGIPPEVMLSKKRTFVRQLFSNKTQMNKMIVKVKMLKFHEDLLLNEKDYTSIIFYRETFHYGIFDSTMKIGSSD